MTTISGRTWLKSTTPGGGWFLRSFTAEPTLLSTILLTSALLTDGFDESWTVAHASTPSARTATTPTATHVRRRRPVGGVGGAAFSSGSTPPSTAVGAVPYLIASTYCWFLGKRPRVPEEGREIARVRSVPDRGRRGAMAVRARMSRDGVFVGLSPVHGRGVFAARSFEPGDLIEECPVLFVPADSISDVGLGGY